MLITIRTLWARQCPTLVLTELFVLLLAIGILIQKLQIGLIKEIAQVFMQFLTLRKMFHSQKIIFWCWYNAVFLMFWCSYSFFFYKDFDSAFWKCVDLCPYSSKNWTYEFTSGICYSPLFVEKLPFGDALGKCKQEYQTSTLLTIKDKYHLEVVRNLLQNMSAPVWIGAKYSVSMHSYIFFTYVYMVIWFRIKFTTFIQFMVKH